MKKLVMIMVGLAVACVLVLIPVALAAVGQSDNGLLEEEWSFDISKVYGWGYFGATGAIDDLPGVNNVGGEPDSDLEIITGSDGMSGHVNPTMTVAGIWRGIDSAGNIEWAKDSQADETRGSIVVADLDGDGKNEYIGGTTSGHTIEALDENGDFVWTFPSPPSPGAFEWPGSPAVADLDPEISGLEVVVVHRPTGAIVALDGDNSDGVDDGITLTNQIGGFTFAGTEGQDWDVLWVYNMGGDDNNGSAAIGDVVGDGALEVVAGSGSFGSFGTSSTPGGLNVINGQNGTLIQNFSTGAIQASPALADLDGDSKAEIAIGDLNGDLHIIGLPSVTHTVVNIGNKIFASAAIGDVDGDSAPEIVVATNSSADNMDTGSTGEVYAFSASGVQEWVSASYGGFFSSPSLADRSSVGAYDTEWPMFRHDAQHTGNYGSSANPLDIYIGSMDSHLYLLDGNDGSMIDRFESSGPIHSSPTIGDIDGDGLLNTIFQSWGTFDESWTPSYDRLYNVEDVGSTDDCGNHSSSDIWSPMWDLWDGNMDFFVKASGAQLTAGFANGDDFDGSNLRIYDSSDTLVDEVFVGFNATDEVQISSNPGEIYRVNVDSYLHGRAFFKNADWARIADDGDNYNGVGEDEGIESNVELGFDERWADVSNQYADTTWYFNVESADTSLVVRLWDEWPQGDGHAGIEWISPSGAVTSLVGAESSGFDHEFKVNNPEPGFWGLKIYADAPFEPYAGHYTVAKHGDGDDWVYLLSGTIAAPPCDENSPEIAVGQPSASVDEADVASNSGIFSDPDGDPITLSATVGNVTDNGDGTWSWSHGTADGPAESQTVKITATDPAGLTGEISFELVVNNVAPSVIAGDDQVTDEGTEINLDPALFSDPGSPDTHTAEIDWGDTTVETGIVNESNPWGTVTGSHTYADNGIYTVTITVTDNDGGSGSNTLIVIVNNVAPSVGPINHVLTLVAVNTSVDADASFTDPGKVDTHTAVWDWDDTMTSAGTVVESDGSGAATGSHVYTTPGIYTITVVVTDNDGDFGTSVSTEYVVVYDPDGGFVTGGGWINSPAGAYAGDPELSGKANFGFVSKYKRGATTPVGQTEFQFHAGELSFHSSSYDWLVVAGAKAQYKGDGKIKGSDKNYGFMLTAVDGKLNHGIDKFRIKIWEIGGDLVYDNNIDDQSDIADPATSLGGGSIVIHKAK